MNALNYFIEANVCLIFVALVYRLLLTNENNFGFLRAFLLTCLAASLLLPLVHLNFALNTLPSIQQWIPTQFLPELIIVNAQNVAEPTSNIPWTFGRILTTIYLIVTTTLILRFLWKIIMLLRWIRSAAAVDHANYSLIESDKNLSSFSFFHFIFIGNAHQFNREEKNQILQHELVHVQKFHSVDIVVAELIQNLFWFNPAVYTIKTNLKDIHEYEADSHVTSHTDPTAYSILMARMALLSVNFSFANHFNQSQTLKRITMINSVKTKMSRLKMALLSTTIPILFGVIACQDQLMDDALDVSKNSTMALDLPQEVKTRLGLLKEHFPKSEFAVIELNEQGQQSATKMVKELAEQKKSVHTVGLTIDNRSFLILEYTDQASRLAELSSSNEVFTIVDTPASPMVGMDGFFKQISQSLKYPENARQKRIEGRVFIEFIVNKDGSLSDFKVVKGFDEDCDAAAMSAMMLSQNWYPAKHQGKIVNERLVLPITFKL